MTASIWTPGTVEVPALPAVAPVLFVPGTVTAPGISFVGDSDTGFWQNVPGTIKVSVDGSNAANFTGYGFGLGAGKKIRLAAEVDLASAATCDIGSATSNYVRITGTTGITSFGVNHAGPMFLRFEGALTLTNSATLIIPGGANITTAAGDTAIVTPKATAGVSDGWQIVTYQRAVGVGSFTTLATSGSVGIGGAVSGTYRLDVQRSDTSVLARFYQAGGGLSTQVYWNNVGAVGNALISRFPTGEFLVQTSGADPIDFYTNGVFRARINSSGNMGVGADASAGTRLYATSSSAAVGIPEYAIQAVMTSGANTGAFSQFGIQSTNSLATGYVGTSSVGAIRGTATVTGAGLTASILIGVQGGINTSANSTITNASSFRAVFTNTGGSVFTAASGYYAEDIAVSATVVAGFRGILTSGTNKYNVYMDGTAPNWFSGDVLIFGAGVLGYTTGSGGTVTQVTSRTTGVTLNKTNGSITLVSAAGSAAWQSFTVTNSFVAATDTIVLSQRSGTDLHLLAVTNVAAGSFRISFATTGGTTVEQPVFNFAVVKAVNA